jgi:NAD dependent epimerase/dehydratase family enzyme
MKKNVLITGGSGFGKTLTQVLIDNGYTFHIEQEQTSGCRWYFYYTWNIQTQIIEEDAVLKADYVIHLAGCIIAEKDGLKRKDRY